MCDKLVIKEGEGMSKWQLEIEGKAFMEVVNDYWKAMRKAIAAKRQAAFAYYAHGCAETPETLFKLNQANRDFDKAEKEALRIMQLIVGGLKTHGHVIGVPNKIEWIEEGARLSESDWELLGVSDG